MKSYKIFSILFIFILLFTLVGCSFSDLERERIEIKEENIKTNLVVEEYDLNMISVNSFNDRFVDAFFTEGVSFEEYVIKEGFESNIEGIKSQIETTIEDFGYIMEYEDAQVSQMIEEFYSDLRNQSNISFYPFLEENSGNVIEHIYISYLNGQIEIVVNWERGKIKDFNYFSI